MTPHRNYWRCGWCQCIRAENKCDCRQRFRELGERWQYRVDGGYATCLVCHRCWATEGAPETEHACGPRRGDSGTILKKMLESYGIPACEFCLRMAAIMDTWGPDLCREKIHVIANAIRAESWWKSRIPTHVITAVVLKAIEKSTYIER